MTKFTVEITDPAQLAGITAAREAYNASLPEGDDAPAPLANDAEYVQFVMGMAAESYARQYGYTGPEIEPVWEEIESPEALNLLGISKSEFLAEYARVFSEP